jgi:hypothetical protein
VSSRFERTRSSARCPLTALGKQHAGRGGVAHTSRPSHQWAPGFGLRRAGRMPVPTPGSAARPIARDEAHGAITYQQIGLGD